MLTRLPATQISDLLMCSGHSADDRKIAHITWTGLRMTELLSQVTPEIPALYANFHSADGYATSIAIADLEDAVLAYEMNGRPLSQEHGYPARLVIPGRYGYKQPKWIQHIILSDQPVYGHWEQRGYDVHGRQYPTATLRDHLQVIEGDLGQPIETAGYVTGGDAVEISIDDGPWNPAHTQNANEWTARWTPTAPGTYTVRVRARRRDVVQPAQTQPRLTVRIVE